MTLSDRSELDEFLATHPGWDLENAALVKTFQFADFAAAMSFVTRLAFAAEKADHHPDIDIRWNRVRLAWSTHSAGGVTGADLELAAVSDQVSG